MVIEITMPYFITMRIFFSPILTFLKLKHILLMVTFKNYDMTLKYFKSETTCFIIVVLISMKHT